MLLPTATFQGSERLRGGARAAVHRVHVQYETGRTDTVVLKQHTAAGEGWVREASALASLTVKAPAAVLLAESSSPAAVVMSDLGRGASVADWLLGDDADGARESVVQWARAVARLHVSTLGLPDRFSAELVKRSGELPVAADPLPAQLSDAAALLSRLATATALPWADDAAEELRGIGSRLTRPERSVLSPTDACPDNNVSTADGVYLVDFEGASFWHAAWDVAYLTVPWPSCWCAWRLPEEVTYEALRCYRADLCEAMPYVDDEEFNRDVAAAAVGWTFLSASWLMPTALTADPPPSDARIVAPSRRAMIAHRLEGATDQAEIAGLPRLAAVAQQWANLLQDRWPTASLALAPAFR